MNTTHHLWDLDLTAAHEADMQVQLERMRIAQERKAEREATRASSARRRPAFARALRAIRGLRSARA